MEQSRLGSIQILITAREATLHLEYPGEGQHLVSYPTDGAEGRAPWTAGSEGSGEGQEEVLKESGWPLLTSRFGWYQARFRDCEKSLNVPYLKKVVYADEPGFIFPQVRAMNVRVRTTRRPLQSVRL